MNHKFEDDASLEVLRCPDIDWSAVTDDSALVKAVRTLWSKPLTSYSDADLRLMISQGVGLSYLLPLAIDRLAVQPLLNAELFPGDLLLAVLAVPMVVWREQSAMLYELQSVIAGLEDPLTRVINEIVSFKELAPSE